MSIESIIGIVAGIAGIGTAVIQLNGYFKKIMKLRTAPFVKKLLEATNAKKRSKVFKEINEYLCSIGHTGISDSYIKRCNNFDKPEMLFRDICFSNDIEPTKDVCMHFIGENRPSLLAEYTGRKTNSASTPAIEQRENEPKPVLDTPINMDAKASEVVYLSQLLLEKYPATCASLTDILSKHHVSYRFLKGTKDIWCRDYMPIQTPSGKLIQFRYEPSYLNGKKEWEDSRSDVKEVCKENNLCVIFSNINLDGGNVLMCDGKAIISDRIYTENPEYTDKEALVKEIGELLESEIIMIPCQKSDITGHADGMVRFVDGQTILGNNREREFDYWRKGINKVIKSHNLKYIDVPFLELPRDPKHPESAIGVYVNYLDLKDLIILPVFNNPADKEVVEIIKRAFPNKKLETINYNEVARGGGLLNCTTWVVRE